MTCLEIFASATMKNATFSKGPILGVRTCNNHLVTLNKEVNQTLTLTVATKQSLH